MKKRILCTLILSLLVLTACSSETPKATPDEITPSAIVETQAQETIQRTIAPTEKPTESTETETVVVTTKIEQQAEVEIVEQAEATKAPAQAQKITQESAPKPTQKPTEKAKQESVKEVLNSSNNEQDIHNIVSYIINHNQSKGMTYDTTLNTSNSGWLFAHQGCLNTTANRTYEEQLSRTVSGLDADIDSILALDGYATSYSQMSFNCYAEKQANGEYNIYFCYG